MNAPIDAGLHPLVVADTRDGVCTLTMNRGDRFNALSTAMIAALDAALDAAAGGRRASAWSCWRAPGRAFCAGHDLTELRAHPDAGWQQKMFADCAADDAAPGRGAAAGDRPRPRHRDCGGLSVGGQLRSRGRGGNGDFAAARRQHRRVLHHAGRRGRPQVSETGDGDAAHRRGRRGHRARRGPVNRVVRRWSSKPKSLVAKDRRRAPRSSRWESGRSTNRSVSILPAPTRRAGEAMACNLLEPDAAEGIDAFLARRPPVWRD